MKSENKLKEALIKIAEKLKAASMLLKPLKDGNYSAAITPKVWCFKKRINPSIELLKPSMASKILETPYLWHSFKFILNSYERCNI
jgi:hypothetical protein